MFANRAFGASSGSTERELMGQPPRLLQGPRTDPVLLAELATRLRNGELFQGEMIHYRQDGTPSLARWNISPVCDDNGKVMHYVSFQLHQRAPRQSGCVSGQGFAGNRRAFPVPRAAWMNALIIRDLASRLRDQAERPVMVERRALWARLNQLQSGRPLLYVIPEGAWVEILPDSALQCADEFHRQLERQLRQRLWLAENVDDDAPVEPWLNLAWRLNPGDYGVPIPEHHGDNRGSYVWEAPLRDLARDLAKLRFRQPTVDRASTRPT